jgi:hypothetical protein
MAELAIKIPSITGKFYPDYAVPQIKDKINSVIEAKYGKLIDNISRITGLNRDIILSFIFIESAGKENAETPYAVGILQVSKATASDALIKEKGRDRLSGEEAEMVKKYLGERYSIIEKVKPKQTTIGKTFITREDLLKVEFNLLVGSIILKQLIDEFTENGVARLDKVAVLYNTGRFSKVGKDVIAHKGTTDELIAKIPVGQGDYVKKLLGVNGLLDLIV